MFIFLPGNQSHSWDVPLKKIPLYGIFPTIVCYIESVTPNVFIDGLHVIGVAQRLADDVTVDKGHLVNVVSIVDIVIVSCGDKDKLKFSETFVTSETLALKRDRS